MKKKLNFNQINLKKLNLNQLKKNFLRKGLILIKKNKFFFRNEYQSLYLTTICSLFIISFFFSLPIIFEFKKNTIDVSKEIVNKSKSNFEKVLDGESLEKTSKIDEDLDLRNLFDDVFKFDDLPNDAVRLNASTIEQLFKETKYNLKDVRKSKLVKPISLSLLTK
jgi:Bax protein